LYIPSGVNHDLSVYYNRGLHIQIRHNQHEDTFIEANRIARLISAAPELLEALEKLANDFYALSGQAIQPRFEQSMVNAMAAIRKAKGE
jgi:hypothetical protein